MRRRPAGFTLLEMAAVLAIAAVLAAVATPSFSGLVARERLNAAAHLLQADIALARHEAGRRGAVVHLHFQTGAQWCYAISTAPAVDCRQPTLVPGGSVIKVVRAPEPPGVTLLAATAMAIDSRSGTSLLAEGQARFASPQSGQQLQVSLGRLGRASICAPAGPVAGAPPCTPPLAS